VKILITGGAGFVGSTLALMLRQDLPDVDVLAFDNLRRRGSELAIGRLRAAGVRFVHGDVRNPEDLGDVGGFDLLIECSAEPSVHAGYEGSPAYVLRTNLDGTLHCLEAARQHHADLIFLSTSRVYPIAPLRSLPLERRGSRFEIAEPQAGPGWSCRGITTGFPLTGHRSLYGATKLASELVIEEYHEMYGLRTVINRCGVIAGPWQMGKVDQGFMALWAARHLFGGALSYVGFGGDGLQVRDVLHAADLYDPIKIQMNNLARFNGMLFNVGGGRQCSTSLAELTALCAERAKRTLAMGRQVETNAADIPYYVTDNSAVSEATGWAPRRGLTRILDDIFGWLQEHRAVVEPILSAPAHGAAPASAPAASTVSSS